MTNIYSISTIWGPYNTGVVGIDDATGFVILYFVILYNVPTAIQQAIEGRIETPATLIKL